MFHLIDGKIAEWGDPDLGGVWDFRTLTPIERPDALGDKEFLTSEEAAAFEEQSLRQWDADRRDGADQDFGIGSDIERAYNNNVQLFQTPDTVVIFNEMIHDARIVPLDGRAHLDDGIRQWMGDPRGRWEGDTLVVETTNFLRETHFRGSSANLHLVERFTRIDEDTLLYEYTASDPTTFSQPWTVQMPMKRSDGRLFEYACHEGNYGMFNLLAGARAEEAEAAGSK